MSVNGEYKIVKVASNPMAPGGGLPGLEAAVAQQIAEGWRPIGGPFHEAGLAQWCQALERYPRHEPGVTELRELGPGLAHVHAAAGDKPLKMREPKSKP